MLDLESPQGMATTFNWFHRTLGAAFVLVAYALGSLIAYTIHRDPVIGGMIAVVVSVPVILGFALYKEFDWDLHNETPQTSGGIPGGWVDFDGYLEGCVTAALVLGVLFTVVFLIAH